MDWRTDSPELHLAVQLGLSMDPRQKVQVRYPKEISSGVPANWVADTWMYFRWGRRVAEDMRECSAAGLADRPQGSAGDHPGSWDRQKDSSANSRSLHSWADSPGAPERNNSQRRITS